MTDEELLALLDSTLGPTLTAAGFTGAQGGWDGVTFCAAFDEFAASYPWLPQASPEEWQRGASVDLVIEFDQTTGLLGRIDLEYPSLPATVYGIGEKALSAELKAAYAWPLTQSLPVVVRALEVIFTPPEDRSDPFDDSVA